ncbi:sensor histidine kinase [Sphingomonas oryzagri]|uniref:histidine kinase n=1 Tax=Sphingomonas oryzagri TaxID=3042314 RepID=A0ABT6N6R4_9SPHN|nr:HAMP domain-containing sensor histidine kinase [Sphingomonas oryzagri]MDH7640800.1 HAMP domain-containing sensor histidine kinase [Sphingomonas oryzagri]
MIGVAALWILLLLSGGGYALDKLLVGAVTRNFDGNLDYVLTAMIVQADIGPDGEVRFLRPLADQRFLEPGSGLYWQIAGKGHDLFPSRSLWDQTLAVNLDKPAPDVVTYDSKQFKDEVLRVRERDVKLPGSKTVWRFQVAESRDSLNDQIAILRKTMVRSFAILGIGLLLMSAMQTIYGLWPLRKVRLAIAGVRSGRFSRVDVKLPIEIRPMVEELNDLLAHNEKQAEEARTHAGNLAHALKTPLTVIMNEATARSPDLNATVMREARTMRRQVDHHLARARAVGRRGSAQSRAEVWPSLQAVERAVDRLFPEAVIDLDGEKTLAVRVERQDLDELLGNLMENAAKYGGGRVFVTVGAKGPMVEIAIEDDGRGIPEAEREKIFERGARLDTGKPGTGLGLAIVRDVAEIYGGTVALEESEDLGGLLVRLSLPAAGS